MHNDSKVKISIKKHGLHSKHKSLNKLSMQRILQGTHENWIYSKSIFLELTINVTNFNYPIQVNSEKACKLNLTNLGKLPQKLDKKTKLTKLVSPFYHFSAKSYAIDNISDSKHENTLRP